MIDFSTLQGLTIPEGEVVKIEDAAGNVLWSAVVDYPEGATVLKVEKITSNTYAGETSYTNEKFILLDIYPKTNGTVTVTYGGLTKTITDTSGAAEPNAQQVFFGKFNGKSDSVTTPDSGTLIIQGDCSGFGVSSFQNGSKSSNTKYYNGILDVIDFGNVTIIPGHAFENCASLKSVIIPPNVTGLGDCAFRGCTGLLNASLPNGPTSLATWVFDGCTSLESVTIPTGLTTIASGAFEDCHKLVNFIVDAGNPNYSSDGPILFNKNKTILCAYPSASGDYTVPSNVTEISAVAFAGSNLTNITVPSSVRSIGYQAFARCNSITNLTMSGILGSWASVDDTGIFRDCTNLTTVTFPSGSKCVGYNMFQGCSKLESVILSSGMEAICNNAFEGCVGLKNITIPSTVTSIQARAFYLAAGNSRTVTMLSTTPPTLPANTAFDEAGTNNFVVPAGCGEVYKAANYWSEYADYITEAS